MQLSLKLFDAGVQQSTPKQGGRVQSRGCLPGCSPLIRKTYPKAEYDEGGEISLDVLILPMGRTACFGCLRSQYSLAHAFVHVCAQKGNIAMH